MTDRSDQLFALRDVVLTPFSLVSSIQRDRLCEVRFRFRYSSQYGQTATELELQMVLGSPVFGQEET